MRVITRAESKYTPPCIPKYILLQTISSQERNPNRRTYGKDPCCDMDRIYLVQIRKLCLFGVCILVNTFASHFMRNRLVNIFSREGHSLHVPLFVIPLCEPCSLPSLLPLSQISSASSLIKHSARYIVLFSRRKKYNF